MTDDEGAKTGRLLLEPPGQAASLPGGIAVPEAVPAARVPGRASRRGGRLGACLAVSLSLHAAVLTLVSVPGSGGRGTKDLSTLRVSVSLGAGYAERDPAAPTAAVPGVPTRTSPETPPSEKPAASRTMSQDAVPPRGAAQDAPDSTDPSAGTGVFPTPPSGWAGSGGADFRSASDQAAALLLARVETALVYPEAARRRGTEGVVGLRIALDGSGTLAEMRVSRSSGSALLDKAAREAVAASLPVLNPGGTPLTFELAVRFSLEKKTTAPWEPPP